jgi:hypothetical protein
MNSPNEKRREDVALFRFSLIADLVHLPRGSKEIASRVEGRRGGVQACSWLCPPFPASCPFRARHHSVSDPRHFERSGRFSRTTLTAEASSHRGYDSL